ncbi:MAG: SCP2 sterol-binding domain-containing protein [Acidimicrobiales bacterium]
MSPGASTTAQPGGEQPGGEQGPSGLVTLIVGSTERPSGRRSAGARPKARTAGDEEAPAGDNPPPAQSSSQLPAQWSAQWSSAELGRPAAGCDGQADLTLTISPEDAALVLSGELAPSVAFMQGRLKTTGDNALLLELLRWSATEAFRKALLGWVSDPELRLRQPAG